MNKMYLSSLFALSFLLIACHSKQNDRKEYEKMVEIVAVNKGNPIEVVKLTDLVDSVKYIPLETKDECLLSHIEYIKQDDGIFFIKAREGVHAFDSNGKFLTQIGRKGDAPGEYFYADCFYLDTFNKRVGIACGYQHKIYLYGYDGVFQSTLELNEAHTAIFKIAMIDKDILLVQQYTYNEIAKCEDEYIVYDFSQSTVPLWSVIHKSRHITTGQCFRSHINDAVSYWGGKTWYIPPFSNIIYTHDGQKSVPSYYIDIPNLVADSPAFKREERWDYSYSKEKDELDEFIDNNNLNRGIAELGECSDYLVFSTRGEGTWVWDGNKGVVLLMVYNEELNLYSSASLKLSSMVQHISANHLYEMKDEESIISKNRHLKKILETLREDDNPVLYKLHLKPNLVEHLCKQYEL